MAVLLATSVITLGQSCYENDSLITNGDGTVQWRFD